MVASKDKFFALVLKESDIRAVLKGGCPIDISREIERQVAAQKGDSREKVLYRLRKMRKTL